MALFLGGVALGGGYLTWKSSANVTEEMPGNYPIGS